MAQKLPSDPNATALDYLAKLVGQLAQQNAMLKQELDRLNRTCTDISERQRGGHFWTIAWGSFMGVIVIPTLLVIAFWLAVILGLGVVASLP